MYTWFQIDVYLGSRQKETCFSYNVKGKIEFVYITKSIQRGEESLPCTACLLKLIASLLTLKIHVKTKWRNRFRFDIDCRENPRNKYRLSGNKRYKNNFRSHGERNLVSNSVKNTYTITGLRRVKLFHFIRFT